MDDVLDASENFTYFIVFFGIIAKTIVNSMEQDKGAARHLLS